MNEKGAHHRLPYDPDVYETALPSPGPSTSAVLPLPQPVPSSPLPVVTTLTDVSLDRLLRDIDTSTVAGTDISASSVSPPANS